MCNEISRSSQRRHENLENLRSRQWLALGCHESHPRRWRTARHGNRNREDGMQTTSLSAPQQWKGGLYIPSASISVLMTCFPRRSMGTSSTVLPAQPVSALRSQSTMYVTSKTICSITIPCGNGVQHQMELCCLEIVIEQVYEVLPIPGIQAFKQNRLWLRWRGQPCSLNR